MARVTVENSLKKVPNRFELTVLVFKRAKQILKGHASLVDSKNKPVVTSLREVAAGKVFFDYEKTYFSD